MYLIHETGHPLHIDYSVVRFLFSDSFFGDGVPNHIFDHVISLYFVHAPVQILLRVVQILGLVRFVLFFLAGDGVAVEELANLWQDLEPSLQILNDRYSMLNAFFVRIMDDLPDVGERFV